MKPLATLTKVKPHHIPFIVILAIGVILSVGLVLTLLQRPSPATTGNIYFTPKSGDAKSGENVTFAVRITPGANIDTVTTTASYDKQSMTYKSVSYTGSPFSSQIPAIFKDNTITLQSARLGGTTVNDDSLIATLTFTAVKDGSHTLELTDGNAAHAGLATNPTLAGKIIEQPTSATAAKQQQAQSDTSSPATDSVPAVLQPAQALLRTVGAGSQVATRAAPWLTGVLACILLASMSFAFVVLYRKVHKRKLEKEISTV